MKTIQKFFNGTALVVAIVLAVIGGLGYAIASTDTYNANTNAADAVGGIPLCVTFDGTSASSVEDLTVTLPAGFVPTWVEFMADYDNSAVGWVRWFYGMPADTSRRHDGTIGSVTYYAASTADTGVTAATGSLIIESALQVGSGNYVGRACR